MDEKTMCREVQKGQDGAGLRKRDGRRRLGAGKALLGLVVVCLLGVIPGATTRCFGQPTGGDKPWQQEADRLSNSRLKPWQKGETPSGAPGNLSSPIDKGMLADNFMGTDPASAIANYAVVDTLKEVGNLFQCMDLKLVPGCMCCVWGIPILPAYEYRVPVARYEVVRQPFQSDYWPTPIMETFQELNPNVGVGLLLASQRLSIFNLGMGLHGFKLAAPGGANLDAMKKAMELALENEKIPDPNDNKGRGGGTVPIGRTTSVHLVTSPLAMFTDFPGLSFLPVRSHITDHARLVPVPSWSEDPLHYLFARSTAGSWYAAPSYDSTYGELAMQLLLDPTGGVKAKQGDWEKTFSSSSRHTTGMAPRGGPLPAVTGSDPDVAFPSALDAVAAGAQGTGVEHPHLRFGNGQWFPFNQEHNLESEPMAAAASAIKQGKLDCNMLGYPDMYDLDDDRFQYLRGDKLEGDSYQCVHPELTFEEFGKANVLERPAKVITISHWKRYTGCPMGLTPCLSCPWSKMAAQRRCNPKVKNASRNSGFSSPPEWPWQ